MTTLKSILSAKIRKNEQITKKYADFFPFAHFHCLIGMVKLKVEPSPRTDSTIASPPFFLAKS